MVPRLAAPSEHAITGGFHRWRNVVGDIPRRGLTVPLAGRTSTWHVCEVTSLAVAGGGAPSADSAASVPALGALPSEGTEDMRLERTSGLLLRVEGSTALLPLLLGRKWRKLCGRDGAAFSASAAAAGAGAPAGAAAGCTAGLAAAAAGCTAGLAAGANAGAAEGAEGAGVEVRLDMFSGEGSVAVLQHRPGDSRLWRVVRPWITGVCGGRSTVGEVERVPSLPEGCWTLFFALYAKCCGLSTGIVRRGAALGEPTGAGVRLQSPSAFEADGIKPCSALGSRKQVQAFPPTAGFRRPALNSAATGASAVGAAALTGPGVPPGAPFTGENDRADGEA